VSSASLFSPRSALRTTDSAEKRQHLQEFLGFATGEQP
jgi:hypothetical protein